MDEIYRVGGKLDLVVTLHDQLNTDKSGRIYVDKFCRAHDIPVLKCGSVNDSLVVDHFVNMKIDWVFIIGWSQIAGSSVLSAPTKGCVGIHPTLLPEGRGRAPIPWAILKGLERTGVTMFKLDEGVDTGPIISRILLPLSPNETATTLYDRVANAHRELVGQTWPAFEKDSVILTPQDDSLASVWHKRTPEDGRIMECMTPDYVERLVRATTRPYPGAFYDEQDAGRRVRIWSGTIGKDAVAPPSHVYRIPLWHGVYDCHDFEFEGRQLS